MRGRTHRKLTVIRLAGYHTGRSCVALPSYQFPRIVDNGIGPNAGRDPRLWATQSSPPRLTDAVQEWRRGHSLPPGTPHRRQKPVSTGLRPRCPHCVHHAAAYWREGFAQPVAGRRLILRPIRRYARSCCATAPPSQRLGAAPLRRAVLFLLERPPVLGSPAVDPRGELSE